MDIRLISSLTDDDENRFASVLLDALTELLNAIPVAYQLRVETTSGKVLNYTRVLSEITSQDVSLSLAALARSSE